MSRHARVLQPRGRAGSVLPSVVSDRQTVVIGRLSCRVPNRTRRLAACVVLAAGLGVGAASAATIPYPVLAAVHGHGNWCGLRGASWRTALVEKSHPVTGRRVSRAMCGNELSW